MGKNDSPMALGERKLGAVQNLVASRCDCCQGIQCRPERCLKLLEPQCERDISRGLIKLQLLIGQLTMEGEEDKLLPFFRRVDRFPGWETDICPHVRVARC